MNNISKEYFDRVVPRNADCQIWHGFAGPCSKFLPNFIIQTVIGTSKFFLPIYLVKIALNRRRRDKKYLKEQVKAFSKSISYGVAYGTIFVGVMCTLMRITGFFYYMLFCGGIFSGFSILLEHHENKGINTLLLFNQALEAFLNYAVHKQIIKRTDETAIFMFTSSVLMYLFKTQKTKKIMNLWFYPVSSLKHTQIEVENNSQSKCGHKDSCLQHGYNETIKYFGIGYALEIVKTLIPRFFKVIASPRAIFNLLFNIKNVRFGLFLGGYVAIYRYVLCSLTRSNQKELAEHSLIAGFLAGCAYRLKPNTQILIIGITTILQLLSQRIIEANNLPEDFPYYVIVFCLTSAVLIQFRYTMPVYCPVYTRNMYDATTNNMSGKIEKNLLNFMKNQELKLAEMP